MDQRIDRVLIDRQTIARRVGELADRIARDFQMHDATSPDEPPALTIVPIMIGSVIFLADLIRHLPLMMRLKLIGVSSYPGKATTSQGVKITSELPEDFGGAHVLIVDDILDSGRTITAVRRRITGRNAASVKVCVLLHKQLPEAAEVTAEYIGFEIPNEFVVGYGLDYDGYFRNLPEICTLNQEANH
jgi:hypoxanthine phosphoribosyltransferase